MPERITRPGVYDLTQAEYHGDPCPVPSLSSSVAKRLLSHSPRHARYMHPRLNPEHESENKAAFDIGKAAHSMLLHQDERIVVVEADSWSSKAAREARDAAYEASAIPLLRDQYERTEAMVGAVRAELADHHQAADAFGPGLAERTVVWQEFDAWMRIKPDWLPLTAHEGMVVYDFKTTAVSAKVWGERTMWALGSDFQAAFYCRGLRHVLGVHDIKFRFVVVEVEPPHALAVFEVTPDSMAVAERDVELAIDLWRHCQMADDWPGYGRRVIHTTMPGWTERARLERQELLEVPV